MVEALIQTSEIFCIDLVATINMFRTIHQSPGLILSKKLCSQAEKIGNELISIKDHYVDSSRFDGNTECVVRVIGDPTFKGNWYPFQWFLAGKEFNYTSPTLDDKFINFVKMVWKSTTKIGVSLATKEGIPMFIVILYGGSKIDIEKAKTNIFNTDFDAKLAVGYLDEETLQELIVTVHNNIRKRHGTSDLVWSKELEREAVKATENLVNSIEEKPTLRVFGRNVWHGEGVPTILTVCEEWYSTHKQHQYSTKTSIKESAPFCQMVWKNTSAIGAALIKKKETYILVVLYSAAGNNSGQYQENVKKPKNGKYIQKNKLIPLKAGVIKRKSNVRPNVDDLSQNKRIL